MEPEVEVQLLYFCQKVNNKVRKNINHDNVYIVFHITQFRGGGTSKNSINDMDDSIRGENILLNDSSLTLACSHTEPYCAACYLTILK